MHSILVRILQYTSELPSFSGLRQGLGMRLTIVSILQYTMAYLYVHLNDSLANEGCPKERPEGDEEVTACDPCQVKQRVGDLRGEK